MEVVQLPILCCCLYMAGSFGLSVIILRLVYDFEMRVFHSNEIFSAEFPVMSYLTDLESFIAHLDKPVDDVRMVHGGGIAQCQPTIFCQPNKGMPS